MKTICIFNLKGGVGKTISAGNIAFLLSKAHSKEVLCIDADSQCNLTQYLDVTDTAGFSTVTLLNGTSAHYTDIISPTKWGGVDIIPANFDLMDFDVGALKNGGVSVNAIENLRRDIDEDSAYDYIIIDCPPAFTAAASTALAAADEVIIPIRLDAFSTSGMANLTAQIRNMRRINPRIQLRGVLATQFANAPEEQAALDWLRLQSGLPVFDQVIRYSKRVGGSTFAREPLDLFSKTCGAAIDYRRLVADLVGGDDDGI